MASILDALAHSGPPLLADGAMGTMLQAAGLPIGTFSHTWTLSHPDEVLAVHAAYVAAGSQLILTNTLNAHSSALSPEEAAALNHAAVSLARQSGARWVAGSMGPGADETQAQALAEAGVDLFWIETQMSLDEALRTVTACQCVSAIPIFVTFSFHREDGLTQAGEPAAQIAQVLAANGVAAVGLNCGLGVEGARERLLEMATASDLPLILKPNAGLPHLEGESWVYNFTPQAWADTVQAALIPQVRIIGGCCGTTPSYIRTLATQIHNEKGCI
jgi:5-methyltetrahydrofolate--homocysteine methyltransferase